MKSVPAGAEPRPRLAVTRAGTGGRKGHTRGYREANAAAVGALTLDRKADEAQGRPRGAAGPFATEVLLGVLLGAR